MYQRRLNMKKNNWIVFAVLVGVIAIILLVIDWRMALSFLLGSAAAVLTYLLTARYCDLALSMRSSGGTMGHFALNYRSGQRCLSSVQYCRSISMC